VKEAAQITAECSNAETYPALSISKDSNVKKCKSP
jgi:hypothetical protein